MVASLFLLSALACGARGSMLNHRHMSNNVADSCKGSACCGMAHYPVSPQTTFRATFDVPGLPTAEVDDSITDFIYFNIFFGGGPKAGLMNQFVPQLMLGQPLCNSTGPPAYEPLWCSTKTYIFGTQYFMEISVDNKTQSHAAAGEVFETVPGETLFTEFALDDDFAWTLTMGVVDDPTRVSVLEVAKPYMGLLEPDTSSWSEAAYDHANVNSCWELYGMRDRAHYPSSGSTNTMVVSRPASATWDWYAGWVEDEVPTCPGAPSSAIDEAHNATTQVVTWVLDFEEDVLQK